MKFDNMKVKKKRNFESLGFAITISIFIQAPPVQICKNLLPVGVQKQE